MLGRSICTERFAERKCSSSPSEAQSGPVRFSLPINNSICNTRTGVFIKMADGLTKSGPASLLIGFVICGAFMWAVNECFGTLLGDRCGEVKSED